MWSDSAVQSTSQMFGLCGTVYLAGDPALRYSLPRMWSDSAVQSTSQNGRTLRYSLPRRWSGYAVQSTTDVIRLCGTVYLAGDPTLRYSLPRRWSGSAVQSTTQWSDSAVHSGAERHHGKFQKLGFNSASASLQFGFDIAALLECFNQHGKSYFSSIKLGSMTWLEYRC